jgi:hypothetical protein
MLRWASVRTLSGWSRGKIRTPSEDRLVKTHSLSLGKIYAPTPPDLIEEMFKDVKTLGPGDLVPGSLAWWRQRGKKPS